MNALIAQISAAILDLYALRKREFADQPNARLNDILHDCSTVRDNPDFSLRTAAEINRAAATIVLEQRR